MNAPIQRLTLTPICARNTETFDAQGLSESGSSQEDRNEAARGVIDALEACSRCPILSACREDTQKGIDAGLGPTHIVQAGVFWGSDGTPDPTLCNALSEHSSAALEQRCTPARHEDDAKDSRPRWVRIKRIRNIERDQVSWDSESDLLPVDIGDEELGDGWDASWAVLRQRERVREEIIRMLFDNAGADRKKIVARVHLDDKDEPAGQREIAEDHEVCEFIRRAYDERGMSRRKIKEALGMSSGRVTRIMKALGYTLEEDPEMRRRGIMAAQTKAENRAHRQAKELGLPTDHMNIAADGTMTCQDDPGEQDGQTFLF